MESEHQLSSPQSSDNKVTQLWQKYFPYWPLFLILITLSVLGAWTYLRYKVPVFESAATLLIKDEKRGMEDSKMMESLNPLASKKTIENEIEVLKSKALMSQVVKGLRLYAPVFREGRVTDVSAYGSSPINIEVANLDSLVETDKIELTYNLSKGLVFIDGASYKANTWVSTPWSKLRFNLDSAAPANMKLKFALVNPRRLTNGLVARLDVNSGKLSSIINLKIKDEIPKRGEDILNALIAAYDRAAVIDKNTLTLSTLAFLDERLRDVSTDLDSIERTLQLYRSRKGAIDLSSQGKLFLQNVSENDQKLNDVNMKMAVLDQVESYVTTKDNNAALVPSTVGLEDPSLNNLLTNLYNTELQYEKLKRTTGENNPQLISVADQISKIKPGILENIKSQRRSLQAGKTTLYSTNSNYNSLLQSLPKQEKDLVEISREQNIKSTIYSFLLQKREETALSHSATISDSRIVDKAESTLDPVGLPGMITYLIAAMLGMGLGIAIITIRELFNNKILFRHEIESMSSFPILGEIFLEDSKGALKKKELSTSVNEEFRMLRTSLHYLGRNGAPKKLLITSTISGEGKSYVAINLARSLALSGKKVIILEFDLNNPTLAQKLGIKPSKGIADLLNGEVSAESVIQQIDNNENLNIITAGTLQENPSELILNEATPELLSQLEEYFDYIIIDSAPVGLISDGYVLSRYSDATLFVVRHKYTPKKMLERLEKNNRINKLKNLALVFNGVSQRGFAGYDYGYGYGNAYRKDPKKKSRLLSFRSDNPQ